MQTANPTLTAINRELVRSRQYRLAVQAEINRAGAFHQGTLWLSDRQREIAACHEREALLENHKAQVK